MVKLVNVGKSYIVGGEKRVVLEDINMEIKEGEFVSIVGASGSGKSTLMHIMGLLDKPTVGVVEIEGTDTSKASDDEISRRRNKFVGFVFQQFNLLENLTVAENVALPTFYCNGKLDFDPEKRCLEILKNLGIEDKRNYLPSRLSGGQQQRVAIARALIMNPKMILADEPTGNLDSKNGSEVIKILESLNKREKVTVVIVTHEKGIGRTAKRQIVVSDGKII